MSEENVKLNNAPDGDVAEPNSAPKETPANLKEAKDVLTRTDKDADKARAERERLAAVAEEEKKRRIEENEERRRQAAERAKKQAEERLLRIEYGGEYRQKLVRQAGKRERDEQLRRDQEARELMRQKEIERAREMDEYMRRESDEIKARAQRADSLLSKVNRTEPQPMDAAEGDAVSNAPDVGANNDVISAPDVGAVVGALEEVCKIADAPIEVGAANDAPSIEANEPTVPPVSPKTEEKKQNTPPENANLGGDNIEKKDTYRVVLDPQSDKDRTVLRMAASYAPAIMSEEQKAQQEEEAIAERKHKQLRAEAVQRAAGIYAEELRLLHEEEARYNAEIAEIRARRMAMRDEREGAIASYLSQQQGYVYTPISPANNGGELRGGVPANAPVPAAAPVPANAGVPMADSQPPRAPQYQAPQYQAPQYQAPQHQAPQYQAPQHQAPQHQAPQHQAPSGVADRGARGGFVYTPIGSEPYYPDPQYAYNLPTEQVVPYPEGAPKEVKVNDTSYAPRQSGYAPIAQKRPAAVATEGYVPYTGDVRTEYDGAPANKKNQQYDDPDAYGEYEDAPVNDELSLDVLADEELELYEKENNAKALQDEQIFSAHDRAELVKLLRRYHKKEHELNRAISRLEKKQKKASKNDTVPIIVEKIGLQKEICELAIDALHSAVHIKSRRDVAHCKRWLTYEITSYNAIVAEYEKATGLELTHLSKHMVRDIIQGKLPTPIQNVYYAPEGAARVVEDSYTPDTDELHRDQLRFIKDYDLREREIKKTKSAEEHARESVQRAEKRESAKAFAERLAAVRESCERDVMMLRARFDYDIAKLEAERDIKKHSFGMKPSDRRREVRQIEKRIKKIKSNIRRAEKLEREDNERYYALITQSKEDEKVRRRARRERLDAYHCRLEVLVAEREEINNRLLALYGNPEGTKKGQKKGTERKINNVRRRYAQMIYRQQSRIAKRLEKIHAPVDMKEKVYDLMNKKVEGVAVIEASRYKLRHLKLRGKARAEIVREMKAARASVRRIDKDVKYLMKRAERHNTLYKQDQAWIAWVVGAVIVLLVIGLTWFFAGDYILGLLAPYLPKS